MHSLLYDIICDLAYLIIIIIIYNIGPKFAITIALALLVSLAEVSFCCVRAWTRGQRGEKFFAFNCN